MPVRRIRVYVDTSVYGGTQDEEFAKVSERFFDRARRGKYLVLISDITLAELDRAPEKVRQVFADLPDGCVEEIRIDDEVNALAQAYIDVGVLDGSSRADAAHVAAATVARADLVLSWNFRHIVNYERIRGFNGVNALNGYPQIEIRSPMEIGNEDESENV